MTSSTTAVSAPSESDDGAKHMKATRKHSFRGFTEAVPLSLSSMAHMTLPLENGVLDGLQQVLQHTLLSCVNYARALHAPYKWTFRDLGTASEAWHPQTVAKNAKDFPAALAKKGFQHATHRTAFIHLKASMEECKDSTSSEDLLTEWTKQLGILGRVSLWYATTALLTPGEWNGIEHDEDTPKCVLYKVVVEYRSLPATGNVSAVQAEELSMLSFGGSVDDDVKYGALASLYDPYAKYVLEIYSVRGKKYKFDLMDSTLSDGTVPRLPSRKIKEGSDAASSDPFVKSLCVTVTDHGLTSVSDESSSSTTIAETSTPVTTKKTKSCALTKIHLTLEGNLRRDEDNRGPEYLAQKLQQTFLCLNPHPPNMVTAQPSGHTILLDPSEAGKVYINGQYVTTWGCDPKIGSHFPALFGMDLHSIPYWHGRIFDYDVLKLNYAQMWQEVLIDARLMPLNISGKLLSRLISGHDPVVDDDDEEEDSDVDLDDDDEMRDETRTLLSRFPTNIDCLESQVMESAKYDTVGISAKALATRFKLDYSEEGFPCLQHEMDWVKERLPGKVPVAVPQRVINVLRRGGYFDTKRTSEEIWFSAGRPAAEGDEEKLVKKTVELLQDAHCNDVHANTIVFFSGAGILDPIQKKGLVRFHRATRQYHVNEVFLGIDLKQLQHGERMMTDEEGKTEEGVDDLKTPESIMSARAFLLGLHIAQEHPDGSILLRYLLQHRQKN